MICLFSVKKIESAIIQINNYQLVKVTKSHTIQGWHLYILWYILEYVISV